jgi:hypothetical protein
MDNPFVVGLITLVVLVALFVIFLVVASGGDGRRIGLAVASFRKALTDPDFANRVEPLLIPPPPQPVKPPKPSGVPLRFLALLQRDGRLVDFLLEDIQAYPDPQIGAAVRDIHRHCQAALKEHLVLEPVMNQTEGATVEVPAGFDPSAIRLTGNVTGQPPFRGVLQHHGWRVREIKLGPPSEGQDEMVLMPAEVEIQ